MNNRRDCHRIMLCFARRIASKQMAVLRNESAKNAEELCALGQCAAALVPLQLAIDLGHLPSRALMAWLFIRGREGIAKDRTRAFQLVEVGARLGCHHCLGVMARCYMEGAGVQRDEAQSLELARESSMKGSRYGQYALGELYEKAIGGFTWDRAQALALYMLAAAQNLDEAQCRLGFMYYAGDGVARDYDESLRWYQLAATQGNPFALYNVAFCYEYGFGVPQNRIEAIRRYRVAKAAGYSVGDALKRLRA